MTVRTAVLLSGGLDSAVLIAHEMREGRALAVHTVQPIYVSTGLAWEASELAMLDRLLAAPPLRDMAAPLVTLSLAMTDVYTTSHWAVTGAPPAYDTPDEDVYLPGRNIVLLGKAGIYCAQAGIGRLVLGPLAGNPFPDATPEFFASIGRTLSLGLARPIEIAAPFTSMHKHDVIRLGQSLGVPFELTLSCMNPTDTRHCGACSKCRERHDAFNEAGIADPTDYAIPAPR